MAGSMYSLLCKNPTTVSFFRTKVWTSRLPVVPPSDIPLHYKVLSAMRTHAENSTKIALMSGDGQGDIVTYKELLRNTEATASFLSKNGFGRKDVACLVMSNSSAFIASRLGVLKCGGLVTTAKTSVSEGELTHQLQKTNSSIIFADEEILDKLLLVTEKCPSVKAIFCIRRPFSSDELPEGVVDLKKVTSEPIIEMKDEDYRSTDAAMISYASVSDRLPAGMVFTHRNISTAADIYQECLHRIMKRAFMYTDLSHERLLHCSSFANIFGILCMDVALILGFTTVLLKKFDPTLFLNSLHSYRPRLLITEPRNIVATLKQPVDGEFKVNSLEYILCNGPAIGRRVRKEFLDQFPSVKYMTSGAGLLDGAPAAMVPNVGNRENLNCNGCAVPTCETKVVCNGKELDVDEVGEICLRGPTVMQGYLDDPQDIADDGWYHTGEIGHIDKHGNIFIAGRFEDFTNVNGHQVCLNELEDILLCHPSIVDAAVVGIEGSDYGYRLKAFVVHNDETLMANEIQLYVQGQISETYKHLTGGVEFTDMIPRGADGRILRNKLLEQIITRENEEVAVGSE